MRCEDRRRHRRVSFACRLTVTDLATGRRYAGRSIDLRRSGIGFFSESFLDVGSRVRLRFWLNGADLADPVEAIGTVRWSRAEDSGAVVGAEFDTVLCPARHRTLCEQLDRRRG